MIPIFAKTGWIGRDKHVDRNIKNRGIGRDNKHVDRNIKNCGIEERIYCSKKKTLLLK